MIGKRLFYPRCWLALVNPETSSLLPDLELVGRSYAAFYSAAVSDSSRSAACNAPQPVMRASERLNKFASDTIRRKFDDLVTAIIEELRLFIPRDDHFLNKYRENDHLAE